MEGERKRMSDLKSISWITVTSFRRKICLLYLSYLKQLIVWKTLRTVADDFFCHKTETLTGSFLLFSLGSCPLTILIQTLEFLNLKLRTFYKRRQMLILFIPFNTGLQLDKSLSRLDLEPVLPPITGHPEITGCNCIYNHPWRHVTLKVKLY